MRSGVGKILFLNGDSYEGEFKKDMLEGQGTYYCHTGDIYRGGFEAGWSGSLGKRGEKGHGEGTVTFPEGDVYIGQFSDGVPHGEGQLRFVDGESVNGTFDMGKWEGTRMYANGDVFRGSFYLNCPSGQGSVEFRGGAVYEGEFVNGEFAFEKVGPNLTERGTFSRGRLQGKGYRQAGNARCCVTKITT